MLVWAMMATVLAQDLPALTAVAPEADAHLFQMSIDSDTGFFTNDAGTVLDQPLVRGRVGMHWAYRPYVVAYDPSIGVGSGVEVTSLLQMEVNQVVHIDRFRGGIDLPLFFYGFAPVPVNATLSEIGLDFRATLLDPYKQTVGLGVGLRGGLPTVMQDRTLPGAARRRLLQPEVVGEVHRGDLSVAMNLGYRWLSRERSPGVVWGSHLVWRVGAGYSLLQGDAHASFEMMGSALFRNPPALEDVGFRGLPVQQQVLVGGWYRLDGDVFAELAIGSSPLKSVAAPKFRVWLGIAVHPPRAGAKDLDGDGFVDLVDQCIDGVEDLDGFEDEDGCPEPDNDEDGLLDAEDQCPLEPEDIDEFQDADGCPDPDNDRDRIPDAEDECPNDREDRDGYKDSDGCPDPSSRTVVEVQDPNGNFLADAKVRIRGNGLAFDGDAGDVFDLHDAEYTISASLDEYRPAETTVTIDGEAEPRKFVTLTLEPVTRTGAVRVIITDPEGNLLEGAVASVTDTDISAETDARGRALLEGVPEGDAQVELRAEGYGVQKVPVTVVYRRTVDMEPVQLQPSKAVLMAGRIEIRDSVYFATASATIEERSHGLLDDVAQIILDNPKAELIQVEGHTDSRGSARYNKELSERRAAAVRQYLIDAGVEPERLVAVGWGEEKPIDPREVPEAWDLNRRVDFWILRWDGEDIDVEAERERVRQEAMGADEEELSRDPADGSVPLGEDALLPEDLLPEGEDAPEEGGDDPSDGQDVTPAP